MSQITDEQVEREKHVKAVCDVLDHLRRHTHEPYWIDSRDSARLMDPLLSALTYFEKAARLSTPPVGAETEKPVAWADPREIAYVKRDGSYKAHLFDKRNPHGVTYPDITMPLFAAPPLPDKANGDETKFTPLQSLELTLRTYDLPYMQQHHILAKVRAMLSTSPAIPDQVGEDIARMRRDVKAAMHHVRMIQDEAARVTDAATNNNLGYAAVQITGILGKIDASLVSQGAGE